MIRWARVYELAATFLLLALWVSAPFLSGEAIIFSFGAFYIAFVVAPLWAVGVFLILLTNARRRQFGRVRYSTWAMRRGLGFSPLWLVIVAALASNPLKSEVAVYLGLWSVFSLICFSGITTLARTRRDVLRPKVGLCASLATLGMMLTGSFVIALLGEASAMGVFGIGVAAVAMSVAVVLLDRPARLGRWIVSGFSLFLLGTSAWYWLATCVSGHRVVLAPHPAVLEGFGHLLGSVVELFI